MKKINTLLQMLLAGSALLLPSVSNAQSIQISAPPAFILPMDGTGYADMADLVTTAPMIIDLQIRKVKRVPDSQSSGVQPGYQRTLVSANVLSLVSGRSGVAAQIQFLIDLPPDAKGKYPKLKKQRLFIFAKPVQDRKDMVQLIRPDALAYYSDANNALVRSIATEAVKLNAPERIIAISSAFHNASTILGEGETQIFLTTDKRQPFGLTVESRAGQRQWAVSTSEILSETEPAPQRNSLLWFRMACGLPAELPAARVGSENPQDIKAAQADYRYVRQQLGACGRTRPLK